jgi:hypothetical protein
LIPFLNYGSRNELVEGEDMRKVLLAFAMMAVAVLMGSGVASAITYAQLDGN